MRLPTRVACQICRALATTRHRRENRRRRNELRDLTRSRDPADAATVRQVRHFVSQGLSYGTTLQLGHLPVRDLPAPEGGDSGTAHTRLKSTSS